jgi:hypothetical protein
MTPEALKWQLLCNWMNVMPSDAPNPVIITSQTQTIDRETWKKKILGYPFQGADRVELSAKGLSLCDVKANFDSDHLITMQLQKIIGRNNIATTLEDDLLTLNQCAHLNDYFIDFWLIWISRHYKISESKVVTFTSHLYDKLRGINGVEEVSHWTKNRNIDFF